jgi:hypothetical protein
MKLRILNQGLYLSMLLVNNTKLKYIYQNYAKWIFHHIYIIIYHHSVSMCHFLSLTLYAKAGRQMGGKLMHI